MRPATWRAYFVLLVAFGVDSDRRRCLAEEHRLDQVVASVAGGGAIADPVLQRSWHVSRNRAHPDWPAVWTVGPAQRSLLPSSTKDGGEVLVTAGEIVSAWRSETEVQMYMQATSEESGRMGTEIRVHVKIYDPDGRPSQRQMKAVVRGKASVELEP